MKQFLTALLVFLALLLSGQDIILDPIEQDPKFPSTRSLASGNWGYYRLGVDEMYKEIYDRAERPVVVFIFDTGGAWSHVGLQAAAWNEKGAVYTGESNPIDGNGHSTHVASSYAGIGASGEAVGICAPILDKKLIRLIPVKVLSDNGTGSFEKITLAIREQNKVAAQLIKQGYFVIYNFSLGGGTYIVNSTEKELREARNLGVFIAAAAGNTGREGVTYPAVGAASHAIGAINQSDERAYFSTYGPQIEYSLPGQNIYGCWKDNTYVELSGTSMATPHSGAVAAILASVYVDATAAQIAHHMALYGFDFGDPGHDDYFGWGLPDLQSALQNPISDDPPPPPDDPGESPASSLPWWAWALIGVTSLGVLFFILKRTNFFNIKATTVMASNKFGYDEIVDTLSDAINAVVGFLSMIEGGFDLLKFLNYAIGTYPKVQEAVKDFGTFLVQLFDLTPQEALDATAAIDANTPDHPVANKIVGFLKGAAIAYDYVHGTISGGKRVVDYFKGIF